MTGIPRFPVFRLFKEEREREREREAAVSEIMLRRAKPFELRLASSPRTTLTHWLPQGRLTNDSGPPSRGDLERVHFTPSGSESETEHTTGQS